MECYVVEISQETKDGSIAKWTEPVKIASADRVGAGFTAEVLRKWWLEVGFQQCGFCEETKVNKDSFHDCEICALANGDEEDLFRNCHPAWDAIYDLIADDDNTPADENWDEKFIEEFEFLSKQMLEAIEAVSVSEEVPA
jgi:hypothetical protein